MSSNDKDQIHKSEENVTSLLIEWAKKIALFGTVYLLGYWNWSLFWILGPAIFCAIHEENKKKNLRRRDLFRAAALNGEKEVILASLDDLPAWVFFPDIDRAEWLNKIIKQMWPYVNHYARDIITGTIEPSLKTNLESYMLKGFKFERIVLGSVPFRIGGVIVYDNVSRDEVVMDLDITYAGDCDITFHLGAMKGGIRNFQLYGRLRVVMKPLISTIPLAGGVQVYFMNNPAIDFDLVGIASVLEIPGLNELLKRIIVETIASMVVLPNKYPIWLSDEVDAADFKTPEPEGVLRIHIVEAKELMKMDLLGKSDPYVILRAGAEQYKTRVIDSTISPKWDEWCQFIIMESNGQQLDIHLWDKDKTEDESLGRAALDLETLVKSGKSDLWINLEGVKHGKVRLRFTWLSLSHNYEDLQAALTETRELKITLYTALLTVFIDSASDLPQPKASSKPEAYVSLQIVNQKKETRPASRTVNPVWEEGFTFSVSNPDSDTLYLKIIDHRTSTELGEITYTVSNICDKPGLAINKQPFRLEKAGPQSELIWSLRLMIIKNENESSEPDTDVVGMGLHRTASNISSLSGKSQKPKPFEKQESSASIGSNLSAVSNEVFEDQISDKDIEAALREPIPSVSSVEDTLGFVELTMSYSVARQRLVIVIHKLERLPYKDPTSLPDPYVKLYLLPERSKDSKRKTDVIKNSINPVYDEKFEYLISEAELNFKQLEVTVTDHNMLSNDVMGKVIINLDNFDLRKPVTSKFELRHDSKKNLF